MAYAGGAALVQQGQPLQLQAWVVSQGLSKGSSGQVSHIGSLAHRLLQALRQPHAALKGLRQQLQVLLQAVSCSARAWGHQQLVHTSLCSTIPWCQSLLVND